MNRRFIWFAGLRLLMAVVLAGLTADAHAQAQEAAARATAEVLAPRLERAGYRVIDPGVGGVLPPGRVAQVRWPVQEGVDYAWLLTGDGVALDLRLYVFDETGALLVADETTRNYCAVQFRTEYTGYVDGFVVLELAETDAGWALLTGIGGCAGRSAITEGEKGEE